MKKKVLYGAALALFASVSMGTLQSCKDDLADAIHQNDYDHKALSDQIEKLRGDVFGVNGEKGALDQLKSELMGEIATTNQNITDAKNELIGLINSSAAGSSQETDAKIEALSETINQQLQALAEQMAALSNTEEVQKKLDALEVLLKAYTDDKTEAVKTVLESMIGDKVIEINGMLETLTNRVSDLEGKLASYVTITEFNSSLQTITENYNALEVRVKKLETAYETQLAAIEAAQREIDELWKDSNAKGDLIAQIYNEFTDGLNEMGHKYAQLSNEIDLLNEAIFGDTGLQSQISQTANALRDEFTEADQELWNAIIERDALSTQYYNALREEYAAADEELWNAIHERDVIMTQYYEALKNEFSEADEEIYMHIEAVREEMTMFMNASENSLKELQAQMENENEQIWIAINGNGGLQEQIGSLYNLHQADIAALDARVSELETQYKYLLGRVNNLITGILVQSTDCPVFGNLSLPIGVQSNILFNWFGFNGVRQFSFPTNGVDFNYKPMADDVETYMSDADWDRLNAPGETIKKGFLGDVNIGKLFLTVNPAGNYFDKQGFSLETSAGNKYPIEFRDMKKSSKELYFGYSRAADQVQGNGFYEVDVVIPEGKINDAKIEIEDGLKQTAKDLLKDPSKRTALNMLKAVYGQLNGMLPNYGVRYKWNVNGQDYSVVSNYNLAATTAKPLSYSFLWDKTIDKRLRTFGHIDNLILKLKEEGKLHFNFEKIEFDDISIELPPITIETEDITPGNTKVVTWIEPIDIYQNGELIGSSERVKVEVDIEDVVNDLTTQMNKAISDITGSVDGWAADANVKINEELKNALDPIADKINNMMDSINGQIDDMLGDLGNQFQPYFDKLNKLVDLYNKVAGKVNEILEDPNHYLQVAMFYNAGNGSIGVLSNSFASPTPFKAAGGNALGLYASSYTGELLAPAYKKYVAVSNIYNENKQKVTTEDALAAINGNGKFLNEVMDGSTIRFGISASSLKKNYTYEIIYQGVDYYGKTSTQKFYITVK